MTGSIICLLHLSKQSYILGKLWQFEPPLSASGSVSWPSLCLFSWKIAALIQALVEPKCELRPEYTPPLEKSCSVIFVLPLMIKPLCTISIAKKNANHLKSWLEITSCFSFFAFFFFIFLPSSAKHITLKKNLWSTDYRLFSYKPCTLHISLLMTVAEAMIEHQNDWWGQLEWRTTVNENWKIILWWFQLVTWGGQEKTFDSRICAWTNRLTDELINNTLADLMRHWFPLRSMPLMPTLMWRHRCSHPQSKHIGRSLAGAPRSPLSCRDEAEIFSIKSTWSQCHHFPLQFSSWLAASVHTHTHQRSRLHINPCVCSTSFHHQLRWNLCRRGEPQLFELVEFVIHLLMKHKCRAASWSDAARRRTQPITQKMNIRNLGSL